MVDDAEPSWFIKCLGRSTDDLQHGDLLCFGHSFRFLGAYAAALAEAGEYDRYSVDDDTLGRYFSGYLHFRRNHSGTVDLVRCQVMVYTPGSDFCRLPDYLRRCLWCICNSKRRPPLGVTELRDVVYRPRTGAVIDDVTAAVFLRRREAD